MNGELGARRRKKGEGKVANLQEPDVSFLQYAIPHSGASVAKRERNALLDLTKAAVGFGTHGAMRLSALGPGGAVFQAANVMLPFFFHLLTSFHSSFSSFLANLCEKRRQEKVHMAAQCHPPRKRRQNAVIPRSGGFLQMQNKHVFSF